MKKSTSKIIIVLISVIGTLGGQYFVSIKGQEDTNARMFTSEVEQQCYIQNYPKLQYAYRGSIGVASKTCETGNTFFITKYPNGRQLAQWLTFERIISEDYTLDKQYASALKETKERDTYEVIIKLKEGCEKQTINIKTGDIKKERIKCPSEN